MSPSPVRTLVVSDLTRAAARRRTGELSEPPVRTLHAAFAEDVRKGLTSTPKAIPPRWLYDAVGSTLFEAITLLPEYYLTRIEEEILRLYASDIAEATIRVTCVVEFGSGSGRKTRLILEPLLAREPELVYRPIDISADAAAQATHGLTVTLPRLRVEPLVGTYAEGIAALARDPSRKLVMFIGSSLGNLDPDAASRFLQAVRSTFGPDDHLLLGVDLEKDAPTIERAYNDSIGVTAAFARNVLARMNRELGADFDPTAFTMRAVYRADARRVEIHLVSLRAQRARLHDLDLEVSFAEGETIHVENSYKFTSESIEALARASGLGVERKWTDGDRWFALYLMRPVEGSPAGSSRGG